VQQLLAPGLIAMNLIAHRTEHHLPRLHLDHLPHHLSRPWLPACSPALRGARKRVVRVIFGLAMLQGLGMPLQSLALAQSAAVKAQPAARPQAPRAAAAPVLRYTTRLGDTLIGLGQRLLLDPAAWSEVQRLNHIADPRRMQPGTILRIPVALLRASPDTATAQAVDGAVEWRPAPAAPAGDAAGWQTLLPGQSLQSGAQVRTLAQGSALLLLANGTRIHLQPDSLLDLDSLQSYAQGAMHASRLGLQRGQARILDNPQRRPNQNLRVITPGAQAVVRGTEFRVGYGDGTTRQTTLDGAVELAAGDAQVTVDKGYGSLSANGQAPLPPVRLLPAPDLPGLAARFERLPLRLTWATQPGAQSWVALVTPADASLHILVRKDVTSPTLGVADLPDGHYLLRVSALDAQGLQGYAAEQPFEVAARPFPPLLQAPGRHAVVRQPRPAFTWSEVQGVASYQLQLCLQADCATPLHTGAVMAPPWTPSSDLPAGMVFWRMASVDIQGKQGPWSDVSPFTYKPAPGPVDLGKSTLQFTPEALLVDLPPPPAGQQYHFTLAAASSPGTLLQSVTSTDGQARFKRPDGGNDLLGVSLVDSSDGTAGPAAQQKITVPPRYPYLWLLFVPLLPAL
jgi:hypothetical protein